MENDESLRVLSQLSAAIVRIWQIQFLINMRLIETGQLPPILVTAFYNSNHEIMAVMESINQILETHKER